MINLIRNYANTEYEYWTVSYYEGEPNLETHVNLTSRDFGTIELAAECMNYLGVGDDDIDSALVDIYSFNQVRAIFKDAKYQYSQDH